MKGKRVEKEEKKIKYDTINVYPDTKERFSTKFKQYKETDDEALTRLMNSAGVAQ